MPIIHIRQWVLLSCLLVAASGALAADLPAFPGAEGFGSTTPGGRGGRVIEVTNLNDAGPGSLREAVEAEGPRIVVFRVSGTIPLERDLVINNPNITIAGQTAPGDGICLKNYKLLIDARDVVVRYLRIRRGAESRRADDGLGLIGGADNVIVDHCTISWTRDEAVNTWHGSKNSTIQWCLISEALHTAGHGYAATLGGTNTTYHHNMIANCPGRNPSIGGNNQYQTVNLDFRNNVVFNWQHRVIDGKPNSINFVGNYYKPGPMSQFNDRIANIDEPRYEKNPTPRWFIADNFMEGNEEISKNNKLGVRGRVDLMADTPAEFAPVRTHSPRELLPLVLADVGATLPKRDSVDTRVVEEVRSGKTTHGDGIVRDPADVGGWPELKSTAPPNDSDHDGMPDWWETKHGLNPSDASDGNKDLNGDGYTNVEKYLNGIDPTKKIDWRDPANNVNPLKPGSLDEPK